MHHLLSSTSKWCWVLGVGTQGGVRLASVFREFSVYVGRTLGLWWEVLGPREAGAGSLHSLAARWIHRGWVVSGLFSTVPPAPSMLPGTELRLCKYL